MMKPSYPPNLELIKLDWIKHPGGLRVCAWTDQKGFVYLGVFTLNGRGKPNGLPCWFRRDNFQSDIVIGFDDDDGPIVIGIDAYVTPQGLHLVLYLPSDVFQPSGIKRDLFAPWGSEPPSLGFIIKPTED